MPFNNPITPRPHQIDALADLTRAFGTGARTQLLMPCASGKSLVARWHAEASESDLTIVLVPSLALVAQTLREWRRPSRTWFFNALVVCSDPTTVEGTAERAEDADPSAYTATSDFWSRQRAQVTTDAKAVMRFIAAPGPNPKVVFGTYHSAMVIAHAQAGTRVKASLLVCDEAHRLAGHPREEFRAALDDHQILADRRLFMTATRLMVASTDEEDDSVVSMDDEVTFGPVAHEVSFGAAISRGLLTDYQVLVVASRANTEDPDLLEAAPAALLDAVRRHGVTRVLSYHGRVAKALAFAETVDGLTTADGRTVRARCVHGKLSTARRRETLHWLGADCPGEVRVVTNAKCLVEGVDVPAVDAALFADPRESIVDVVQAVGRVLRPSPGKVRGSIIIPVSVPLDGDEDTELTLSQFGTVWAVVRGLRAHDDRLGDDLDTSNRLGARGEYDCALSPSQRVQFILPDGVSPDPIHVRLVAETSSTWERFFGLLEAYAWRTGGAPLPRCHYEGGVHVGEWAERQRIAYRRGRMPRSRRERLEEVPGWAWDRADGLWQATFDIATAFAEAFGSVTENEFGVSVFDGLLDAERRPLGRWFARQRQVYRQGALAEHRAQALESLPGWTWTPVGVDDLAMVDALRGFVEWEKHADVPDTYLEDGLQLGAWCWAVRRRRLTGRLHPTLFDEITVATPPKNSKVKVASVFRWKADEAQWRLSLSALRQFTKREGHTRVPGGHVEELPDATVGLGMWVAKQRHDRRRGRLDVRYEQVLSTHPGWMWDAPPAKAYGEPIDLGRHRHGSAAGSARGCPCEPCVEYSRDRTRTWKAKRRQLPDGVPATRVREHVTKLLIELTARMRRAGSDQTPGVDAVAVAANVPVGTLRTVMVGRADIIRQPYEVAVLALTAADVFALFDRVGSRGRLVMTGQEKLPAAPTVALLKELYQLGWPPIWVGANLGYDRKVQLSGDTVTRRVADTVAQLHARIAGTPAPRTGRRALPTLDELVADGTIRVDDGLKVTS